MTFNHIYEHLFKRRNNLLLFFFVLICLFSKPSTQSGVFTSQFMHIVDLNGDGRDDLLFYEKKRDGEISIVLNTGVWKDMPSLEKNSMPSDEK